MANFLGLLAVLLAVLSGSTMGWFVPGCRDVFCNFDYCEAYLVGGYNDVPSYCCDGLKNLNDIAKHEEGGPRRICECIERNGLTGGHPPYSEQRIKELYVACHIHLSFPISEGMDCSKYCFFFFFFFMSSIGEN
jgi:hypothetical protein